ncbi:PssE/Cps14G family polysaccharide biosynthesis glycosyltransferase [uncultured Methanobacterium sp.]|uniref:PssE/Cps14G family polysaccharide biosynthesis glycosyltransferase n=1 Tax=uncultured Methanobacterium sp. TaxID=176306 RepID=UPI002AA88EDD|nr:PssE/Cps14G family polysaccharide biosynthesis glycosyltransferase [uncultured Methanobacterium sp.]
MIFVTVGTHNQGFERLIKKMDEIAGKIDEEVVIQIGFTEFKPVNAQWFKFKDIDDIKECYKNATVIVAHAGAGTLLDSLYFKKSVVAVPRRKKYGEHIDDQQLELTEALEKSGKVLAVYDIETLDSTIKKALHAEKSTLKADKCLSIYLNEFIRGLDS